MDSSQLIFVNSTSQVVASIEYATFLTYSTHFEDITWEDNNRKKISIPSLPQYNELQVVEHVIYIVECLKLSPPTLTSPVNDLTPGIKTIHGYVANLEILLLLVLNLEIDIFITEVINVLKTYVPILEEIPTYFHIYTDILRSHYTEGYTRILITLLDNVEPLRNEVYPIIDTILSSPLIPLYDRCRLCLKMYGKDKTIQLLDNNSSKDTDLISRRKIYNLTGFKHGPIQYEQQAIETTRHTLIDSIFKYGEAVRIAPTNTLFYFYVTDIHFNGNINLGNVILPNEDEWTISLQYKNIFSVDDFNDYKQRNVDIEMKDDNNELLPLIQLYRTENDKPVTPLIQLNRIDYVDALRYHTLINNVYINREYMFGYRLLKEDTKYRQWLNDNNSLSESEKIFLSKRHQFMSKWPLSLTIPTDAETIGKMNLNIDIVKALYQHNVDYMFDFNVLQNEESDYYQSQEGKIVEQLRQPSRNDFFTSSDRYGGLIIGLPFYNVVSINHDNKSIILSFDLFHHDEDNIIDIINHNNYSNIYHTLFLPTNFEGYITNLPRYRYITYDVLQGQPILQPYSVVIHPNLTNLCRGDGASILIECDDGVPDFAQSYENVLGQFDPDDYREESTFFIIDPSSGLIKDIEDIKNRSNPLTTTFKQKVLAYPYYNPKIYITSGIWNGYGRYIWYSFNSNGDVVGFILSNNYILPKKLTL
jgi:hypothetical protein